ncbi:MAG: NAD(P)-dependent oxidoreductase [Anaerolineae bacterium]|nr:NAD(P)-dependent oxidoreductase [Anaerolineae bacterium]
MRVLLTGAFGNIGMSALEALLDRWHQVRCFDTPTEANRARAARFGDKIETVWGDLRNAADVNAAVQGQDVVVHLGFIIPKLSATGTSSEDQPDLAWEVNVGGTHHIVEACRSQPRPPKLIFSSSYHVFGVTQHLPPPRTATDPVDPIEHYSKHKVACEWMVKASNLQWSILRFSATLPIGLTLDPYLFQIPLDNRMEFTHTRDVGVAVANAVSSEEIWGKLLLIGGGPKCQLLYGEIVSKVMTTMGIGMLPAEAFGGGYFPTDWVDSSESERLLHYQQRTFDDYTADMRALLGSKRHLIRLARPFVRAWLLRKSPYWQQRRIGRTARQPVPGPALP